jgi:SsrA-binding protein
VVGEEVYLYDAHISPYEQAYYNPDPKRPRKLLLHRREIRRLLGLVQQKGLTLVPLRIYFRGRYAKVELAVARGKKVYDKRESLAKRDAQREMDRALKSRNRV